MPKSRATRSPDSFVRLATATSSMPESFWKPGMCRLRVFLPAPTKPTRIVSPLTDTGVREAGVDRGWPATGARRSFVAGSARPAHSVGGLRQTRVAHLRDMVALRTRGWYPLAPRMMLVRALVLLPFVAYLVTLPPHLVHHLFEHDP